MTTGLIQLIAKGEEDNILTLNPEITYFKYVYKNTPLFYRTDLSLEAIKLNWDDNYVYNVDRNIHLLGDMTVKITIPYFQLTKTDISKVTNIISNSILTKIIYDNYPTYMFLINNSNLDSINYYLIPQFLLFNNLSKYSTLKIPFNKIKQYFHTQLQSNIDDTESIYFLSFTDLEFINEVIPLLLKFGNIVDQYYINTLTNNATQQQSKNLLLPNSYDSYLTDMVKDRLFFNYQTNNSFDDLDKYHKLSSNEIHFYYDYYKNNIYTYNNLKLDSIRAYNYYLNNIFLSEESIFIKDAIVKNSLLLQYFILNLHTPINKPFTFYKKFDTVVLDVPYELILTNDNIIAVDNEGNIIDNPPDNKISAYYPRYTIDINKTAVNTLMTITTIDGKLVTYYVSPNDVHTLTISNPDTSYTSDNLVLIIEDPNRTSNDVNTGIINTDYNLNNEWINNIKINLDNLEGNVQMESLLFNSFKVLYFLQETTIKNIMDAFPNEKNNITNLWIELRTYNNKFTTSATETVYTDINTFHQEKELIKASYSSISQINKYPQDIFNIYLLSLINFIKNIQKKYFADEQFITWFHNKIVNYFYMRFIRISQLKSTNITAFVGLLFYINLDMREYFSKETLRNYLLELFEMTSFIGHVNFNNIKLANLKSFELQHYDISKFTSDESNAGIIKLDHTEYFHELRQEVKYTILSSDYTVKEKNIIINKELFYYYNYHGTLTKFTIEINDQVYEISKYTLDSTSLILTTDSDYIAESIIGTFTLKESTKIQVPLVDLVDTSTAVIGEENDFTRVILLDKTKKINKFITSTSIQISKTIDTNTSMYIILTIGEGSIYYQVQLIQDDNGYYNFTGNPLLENLLLNYLSYDAITLDVINLPSKTITITDSDCVGNIKDTFPYIKLALSSNVYDSTLLITSNTFNTTSNKPIRFVSNVPAVLNTDNSVKVAEHIKLLVLDADNSDYVDSLGNGSIEIKIFQNKYLPNMITFTTLNLNSINQISIMDYFIQKPILLKLNSTDTIPIFLFANIPNPTTSTKYTSHETFLNNIKVSNITSINSNQIIRDNNANYGDRLYSSYFDKVNIKNYSQMATIKDTILNELDATMSSTTFNGKIIKIIEDSYQAYINTSITILDNIENTDIYGASISKLYETAVYLNEFNTISNYSKYKLPFNKYDLLEYDGYSVMSPGLYDNFTTINKHTYKFDKYVFYALNKKFNYTGKIFRTPWLSLNTNTRTSKTVNDFLYNFSLFAQKQFDYIDNNLVANNIFNNCNFKQEIITQDDLDNNYIKLTHKVNTAQVTLNNKSNYTQYINSNSDDIYTHVYYKNRKVDVSSVGTDDSLNLNTSLFPKYENKNMYVETITNNNNHKLDTTAYNLLGAIEVKDNKIALQNESYTVPDNLIVNGHLLKVKEMISGNITSWNESRFNGIQYNCQSIETMTFEEKVDEITKLTDKIYYMCLETTNLEYYLNEDVNYLVQINDIIGCMKYVSGLLILYTNKQIILRNKLEIFYNETSYSDEDILNVLILNSKIIYYNSVVISNYEVVDISSFNAYCKFSWYYGNFIFLDTSDNTIFQNYSDYIKFLDDYVLFNFIDTTTFTTRSLNVYSVTTKLQPPLLIDKLSITRFNPLNDLNWLENKEYWLSINDNEFQIKDIMGQTISDGNYLLYYCPSIQQPTKRVHLDLYYNKLNLENVSSMTFNPYKNQYLISQDFSELTFLHKYFDTTTPKLYKYYVYGTNNSKLGYYYPLSVTSSTNATAFTFSEYSQTFYMPNDDINTVQTEAPDISFGLTQYTSITTISDDITRLAKSSVLIDQGNNIGIISSIITNSIDLTTTLVLEQEIYINTDIVINKNNTLITRPLTITNESNFYTYTLKNNIETDETDNFFIIPTTSAGSSELFLTKVIFDSSYSSDVINLITNNDNVIITQNSNLNWSVNVKNTDKFASTTSLNALNAHKIILDLYSGTIFKGKVILWLVISDIYPDINLIATTDKTSVRITEPLYLTIDSKTQISIENDINDDFYFVDSKYFSTDIADSDIIISSKSLEDNIVTDFLLYGNEPLTFDEIIDNNDNFYIKSNTSKIIKAPLKTWDYLDSFQMNFKKILENTELLKNYQYYIFSLDNFVFFNERKDVDASTSAVELIYNIIEKYNVNYPFDVTIAKADVFVYNYEPIFIKTTLNCIVDINTVYIYCNFGQFERNQVIKIWDNAMRILYYSNYHGAYVAYLMSSGHVLPNIIDGYYSLGKLNNYLDRNYLLKNYKIDNLFHVKDRDLIYGDYYIDNNELKIYTDNAISNLVYTNIVGSYFNLLYHKENNIASFYYDPSQIDLEAGMMLYYKCNDNSVTYQLIINYIDNNQIFFINGTIYSGITSGTSLRVYLPIQTFKYNDINIQDNYIGSSNFNGWIETIDNSSSTPIVSLYRVVDSYISTSIADGTYRVLDITNFNLSSDFSNSYIVDNDTSVNNRIPLKLSLDINYDNDGNIYFTNDTAHSFDFTSIQHCYYQQILVNDNVMNIVYVTETKLYINKTLTTLPIKYNSNNKYNIIISAGNVNNNSVLSNRYKLSNNYFFTYPNITLGKFDLNVVFQSYFNEAVERKLVSFINDFNYNIEQALLYEENNNIKIDSTVFINLINSSVWRDDIYKNFYIDNYIPLSFTDTDNLYFKIEDSTFLPKYNSSQFIPYTTQKIDGTKTSVLIEENYNGTRYLHYVDILLVNYNIPNIVSNNVFKSLEESTFYLNRTIPIRITENKCIQILNPEYIYNKEINNKIKETLEYYIYIKVKVKGIPVKSQNNWKYPLDINETKYNYLKNKDVYYSSIVVNTNTVKEENGQYYLYSDRYIESRFTHLFFKQTNYINKITFTDTTLMDEYNNIDDTYFIDLIKGNHFANKYKNQSLLNIDYNNEEYHLSFKTNQPLAETGNNKATIVNFGSLDDNYYVNKTNKITSINLIDSDDKYTIEITHDIYNITSNLSEYELYHDITNNSTNYIEKSEVNPSSRTMIELLKDKGIDLSLILNNKKPWEEWSLVTLHHNNKFTNIIKDGIVYINRQIKYKSAVTFDTNEEPDKIIESRFTQNEVDMIQALLDSFYITNENNPEEEYNKFIELREIENYIYQQLFYLTQQDYFWNNIDSVILNLVENYDTTNGYNQWTFYKGCIMTNNYDVLEINEIGSSLSSKSDYLFDYDGTRYTRKYHLTSDFTVNYYTTNLTDSTLGYYLGSTFFVVERDHSIINSEIVNVTSKVIATFYGNMIDNIVVFLKELYQYKSQLEPSMGEYYTFYLYGTPDNGTAKGKSGFYYPLSLNTYENDSQYTFKEFPNTIFYLPDTANNTAVSLPPPTISGLINYNKIKNISYYIYYLYGTSNLGSTSGTTGYYYPLSLTSFSNDHPHTFEEFPNITFYMPDEYTTHNSNPDSNPDSNPPSISSELINYNDLYNTSGDNSINISYST